MEAKDLALKNLPDGKKRPMDPFRRAVVRGLAVLLPPLLTIVIFLWILNTVANYLLLPLENSTRWALNRQFEKNIVTETELPKDASIDNSGQVLVGDILYKRTPEGKFIPEHHYDFVKRLRGGKAMPETAAKIYEVYVDQKFLRRHIVIPIFLLLFLLILYLLGRFMAAGVGRFFWMQCERVINRLPIVRNVYSSVKQVTDFMFSEREIEYTRVIAIEYPRKGIWSLGMVTGESLLDISCAANEPVLSVLIPTSPMPFTGYTVTVKKSEAVDLNLTIDQAFQFIVSCGVVVPTNQVSQAIAAHEASRSITEAGS
ncbi:DUF502 domain-containing protein [Adhaeretor mobilis]|uniref:DUF502 domain-containing protein n=1 Tax=Adhaeretor mobilis TaxID=1930276 RepID=A0A517MTX6_9BACT|nr:DUF502 domain-containing protein [Adhaeretor mobilis]QDS98312.1 hypothetical protein HG15A2_15850 [Adhaeretor mobilis]